MLDIVPQIRLVFTDTYSKGWEPAPDPFMTAILLFSDSGDGRTIYAAIARYRNAVACKANADMGFLLGWGIVATQLETYAKGLMT